MKLRRWIKSAATGLFVSPRFARRHPRSTYAQSQPYDTQPLPDLNTLTPAERERLRAALRSEQSRRIRP